MSVTSVVKIERQQNHVFEVLIRNRTEILWAPRAYLAETPDQAKARAMAELVQARVLDPSELQGLEVLCRFFPVNQ